MNYSEDPFETQDVPLTEQEQRWEDAHREELAFLQEYEAWLAEEAERGDNYPEE